MILDELSKNINLIIWLFFILLFFILLINKKIKFGHILDLFKRKIDIRIMLLNKNDEIINIENTYTLLYEDEFKPYKNDSNEKGMKIKVKRNEILEVFVLKNNKKVGSQRINSGNSQIEFIELKEEKD